MNRSSRRGFDLLRNHRFSTLLSLCLVASIASCTSEDNDGSPEIVPHTATSAPVVRTTFFPVHDFARRIAGDWIVVECPLPAGADPIFWKPTADDVARYQAADLVLVNGAEFEKWVAKVSLPRRKVVRTARSFAGEFIEFEEAVTHRHGPGGEHVHVGVDGHTWVSPRLAREQARAIFEAFSKLLPDYEAGLRRNCSALTAELAAHEAKLKELEPGGAMYASHPAYDYLARDLGWTIVNLDLDPERVPSAKTLAAIEKKLAKTPAKILLWESEPTPEVAKAVTDATGLENVVYSPAENPDDRDASYVEIQERNIERLRNAISRSKG